MAAIGIGIGAGAAAIGAITGRTHFSEIELSASPARRFDLGKLDDVTALRVWVEDQEVIVAAFRELVAELLPVLRQGVSDRDGGDNQSESEVP
jgi:hypothetical protein